MIRLLRYVAGASLLCVLLAILMVESFVILLGGSFGVVGLIYEIWR